MLYVHLTRPSIFVRDKPILLSERILNKDYNCKGSVEKKIYGCESQGAWCQGKLISAKLLVIK
jgi:hypothetical protein